MATKIHRPDAIGTGGNLWTASAGNKWDCVDPYDPIDADTADNTHIYPSGTLGHIQSFTVGNLPAGADSVSWILFWYYIQNTSGATTYVIEGRIKVGAAVTAWYPTFNTIAPSGNWQGFFYDFGGDTPRLPNPADGDGKWNVADLNAAEIEIRVTSGGAPHTWIDVYYLYLYSGWLGLVDPGREIPTRRLRRLCKPPQTFTARTSVALADVSFLKDFLCSWPGAPTSRVAGEVLKYAGGALTKETPKGWGEEMGDAQLLRKLAHSVNMNDMSMEVEAFVPKPYMGLLCDIGANKDAIKAHALDHVGTLWTGGAYKDYTRAEEAWFRGAHGIYVRANGDEECRTADGWLIQSAHAQALQNSSMTTHTQWATDGNGTISWLDGGVANLFEDQADFLKYQDNGGGVRGILSNVTVAIATALANNTTPFYLIWANGWNVTPVTQIEYQLQRSIGAAQYWDDSGAGSWSVGAIWNTFDSANGENLYGLGTTGLRGGWVLNKSNVLTGLFNAMETLTVRFRCKAANDNFYIGHNSVSYPHIVAKVGGGNVSSQLHIDEPIIRNDGATFWNRNADNPWWTNDNDARVCMWYKQGTFRCIFKPLWSHDEVPTDMQRIIFEVNNGTVVASSTKTLLQLAYFNTTNEGFYLHCDEDVKTNGEPSDAAILLRSDTFNMTRKQEYKLVARWFRAEDGAIGYPPYTANYDTLILDIYDPVGEEWHQKVFNDSVAGGVLPAEIDQARFSLGNGGAVHNSTGSNANGFFSYIEVKQYVMDTKEARDFE